MSHQGNEVKTILHKHQNGEKKSILSAGENTVSYTTGRSIIKLIRPLWKTFIVPNQAEHNLFQIYSI